MNHLIGYNETNYTYDGETPTIFLIFQDDSDHFSMFFMLHMAHGSTAMAVGSRPGSSAMVKTVLAVQGREGLAVADRVPGEGFFPLENWGFQPEKWGDFRVSMIFTQKNAINR